MNQPAPPPFAAARAAACRVAPVVLLVLLERHPDEADAEAPGTAPDGRRPTLDDGGA